MNLEFVSSLNTWKECGNDLTESTRNNCWLYPGSTSEVGASVKEQRISCSKTRYSLFLNSFIMHFMTTKSKLTERETHERSFLTLKL